MFRSQISLVFIYYYCINVKINEIWKRTAAEWFWFLPGVHRLAAREIVTGRHLTHRPAINSSWFAFVTPQQCRRERGRRAESNREEGGRRIKGRRGVGRGLGMQKKAGEQKDDAHPLSWSKRHCVTSVRVCKSAQTWCEFPHVFNLHLQQSASHYSSDLYSIQGTSIFTRGVWSLTLRSLWTISCWWMWLTLSRIWLMQWLEETEKDEEHKADTFVNPQEITNADWSRSFKKEEEETSLGWNSYYVTVKVHDEHTSKDRNATKKIKKRIWLNRFLLFTLYSVTVLK